MKIIDTCTTEKQAAAPKVTVASLCPGQVFSSSFKLSPGEGTYIRLNRTADNFHPTTMIAVDLGSGSQFNEQNFSGRTIRILEKATLVREGCEEKK